MGKKLSPDQLALYKRIDEVLHYIWDPIGVSTMSPIPRDEYQSYLPQVFRRVLEEAGEESIVAYLSSVERDQMGMNDQDFEQTRLELCRSVARMLISDWNELREYHAT
jgi:hypothetical protein